MIISPSKIGKLPSCQHRGRMPRLMVFRTERSASIAAFLAQRSSPDASCSAEIASASWSALRGYARAKTPSEDTLLWWRSILRRISCMWRPLAPGTAKRYSQATFNAVKDRGECSPTLSSKLDSWGIIWPVSFLAPLSNFKLFPEALPPVAGTAQVLVACSFGVVADAHRGLEHRLLEHTLMFDWEAQRGTYEMQGELSPPKRLDLIDNRDGVLPFQRT